jgi:hypothetical protein
MLVEAIVATSQGKKSRVALNVENNVQNESGQQYFNVGNGPRTAR